MHWTCFTVCSPCIQHKVFLGCHHENFDAWTALPLFGDTLWAKICLWFMPSKGFFMSQPFLLQVQVHFFGNCGQIPSCIHDEFSDWSSQPDAWQPHPMAFSVRMLHEQWTFLANIFDPVLVSCTFELGSGCLGRLGQVQAEILSVSLRMLTPAKSFYLFACVAAAAATSQPNPRMDHMKWRYLSAR